jgi:hypothetical protein
MTEMRAARLFCSFVWKHGCRDFLDAYTVASRLLHEPMKQPWCADDAIDAVLRTYTEDEREPPPKRGRGQWKRAKPEKASV